MYGNFIGCILRVFKKFKSKRHLTAAIDVTITLGHMILTFRRMRIAAGFNNFVQTCDYMFWRLIFNSENIFET